MNDEELDIYREVFSDILSKQWFKRMEEQGLISKGFMDKFEIKFEPKCLEPEFKEYPNITNLEQLNKILEDDKK